MKKFLIIGNHTCANRGDAAILRGLFDSLRKMYPDYHFEIMSRHVMAGRYVLNQQMIEDFVYLENNKNKKRLQRVKKRISFELLLYSLVFPFLKLIVPFFLSKAQKEFCKLATKFDAIIQVGGSFFVDLYGIGQYENLLLSSYLDKDIHLIGHSLGPFKIEKFKRYSKIILPRIREIKVRDTESMRLIQEAGLLSSNISYGADTAWLVDNGLRQINHFYEFDPIIIRNRKIIAITVRDLFPFDKRLGISQNEYENRFAALLEKLIRDGYSIVCVSMCTGLDSYNRDDRMIGLRIKYKLSNPEKLTVLMNEYSDLEIGAILSNCMLLIGTRLHSVILSLLFHTPIIAILYEHKSKGLLDKLGVVELSFLVQDMYKDEFYKMVLDILNRNEYYHDILEKKVSIERNEALKMIRSISFRKGEK